jgi:predicted nucleotidyltransferase
MRTTNGKARVCAGRWRPLPYGSVRTCYDVTIMGPGRGLIVTVQPQQNGSPDLGFLRTVRRQILAAASRRGLGEVRVFGSVARGEAIETSDVDLLVAPGPNTTLFDLSGFALDVEEIVGRHVDVATPRGLKARIRGRVLAEAVAL